jgi:hypothetical protein
MIILELSSFSIITPKNHLLIVTLRKVERKRTKRSRTRDLKLKVRRAARKHAHTQSTHTLKSLKKIGGGGGGGEALVYFIWTL